MQGTGENSNSACPISASVYSSNPGSVGNAVVLNGGQVGSGSPSIVEQGKS